MRLIVALAGVAAATLPVAEAYAQTIATVRVRAGAGAQVRPEWPGASDREVVPYWDFGFTTGETFGVGAPDDSIDIALFSTGDLSIGPALNIERGRDESDVGAPVGDVSTTVEAGAFAQYDLGDSFRLRAELRRGIGGHDGTVGQVGADYVARDADNYTFTIGPRLLFSDASFQRAYFGVSPETALATGLEPHDPGGGLHAVAATSGVQYSLGGNWGLFGYARYERLVGDAANSPIIREYGSPDQFSAGLGINYAFTLRL